MSKHSLLSPSSSKRWLECPPSARLTEKINDETSVYAREGTDAHTLCEYKVNRALGLNVENPIENLSFYDEEMEQSAEEYMLFVLEAYQEEKDNDPVIITEQRLDISNYVPDCSGTGDCLIIANRTLHIIDFKYGKGIEVTAENNTQMMLYALGALDMFESIYEIENINMTIFQPRLSNISTSSITVSQIKQWANEYLKPRALLAYEGKGEMQAGAWCRFCKIKATCRKRAEKNMQLAAYDFKKPPLISDEEVIEILKQVDEISSWISDIQGYAFSVLSGGGTLKGFKLVEGRSNRKYLDEKAVIETVKKEGLDPYEHKVLGITAMTKLLGKSKFEELLKQYIYKPKGKPTLALESDKRPALEINDFKNDTEEK